MVNMAGGSLVLNVAELACRHLNGTSAQWCVGTFMTGTEQTDRRMDGRTGCNT